MSSPTPLVTPADLGIALGIGSSIDTDRATAILADVQTLCASVVTLTPECAVVIKRVAARAYVSTPSPRGGQLGLAGSPIGQGTAAGANPGGVVLWKSDKADLRRLTGGSSAYSIDPLGDTYTLPSDLPYWDATSAVITNASGA